MSADVAASIKARLLNKSKERGEEFELFLVRYAVERFLYRLGASSMRDRCVLKGATLLTLWMDDPYRASRDIDLLASGPTDADAIRAIVAEVCATPCPEDGIRFDLESLDVSPIHAQHEFVGQRATLRAFLGSARMRVQVDFGVGDAVTPPPEDAHYPTMLTALPAPFLRTYPRVVSIAEKFEAMVTLGRQNSRMKDFHDVWALSSAFAFEGSVLRDAIEASFARRRVAWDAELPVALTVPFYEEVARQARWDAYLRAGAVRLPPPQRFEEIGERVRGFLLPVRDAIVSGQPLEARWQPGGPWSKAPK